MRLEAVESPPHMPQLRLRAVGSYPSLPPPPLHRHVPQLRLEAVDSPPRHVPQLRLEAVDSPPRPDRHMPQLRLEAVGSFRDHVLPQLRLEAPRRASLELSVVVHHGATLELSLVVHHEVPQLRQVAGATPLLTL